MPLMPASDPVKATFERKIAALEREIRALQRGATEEDVSSVWNRDILFSYSGAPVANQESGAFVVPFLDSAITRLDVSALTAGTAASILSVRVNGAEAYALTIPASATLVVEDGLFIEVSEMDFVSMKFTTVGLPISTVVVNVRFDSIGQ